MAHQPAAIVGVGQTHHKTRRWDVSLGGLVREAAFRALEDAQMDWTDIDAVVLGKAPDLFEGVMKPELYLSDALGARRQADVPGAHRRLGRRHHRHRRRRTSSRPAATSRVLAVAFQKQSEGNAQFALGSGKGALARRRRRVRPVHAQPTSHRSGAPDHIGPMVAVKDRQNALKNPYAHLQARRTSRIEKVKASPMMWDPIRFLESCPSSDGACAVVFTDEDGGKAAAAAGRPPAWILGQRRALGAVGLPGP